MAENSLAVPKGSQLVTATPEDIEEATDAVVNATKQCKRTTDELRFFNSACDEFEKANKEYSYVAAAARSRAQNLARSL